MLIFALNKRALCGSQLVWQSQYCRFKLLMNGLTSGNAGIYSDLCIGVPACLIFFSLTCGRFKMCVLSGVQVKRTSKPEPQVCPLCEEVVGVSSQSLVMHIKKQHPYQKPEHVLKHNGK